MKERRADLLTKDSIKSRRSSFETLFRLGESEGEGREAANDLPRRKPTHVAVIMETQKKTCLGSGFPIKTKKKKRD